MKKWSEMSAMDIIKLKEKQCSKCKYLSGTRKVYIGCRTCDYILIHEKRRGCDPRACKEAGIFQPRKRGRSK